MTHTPIPTSELDRILTAQFAVAWAGEKGEEPRLGWWRSDLVSEFGGLDLFRRLTPHTSEWATWQAVREAARRKDAEMRGPHHDPDQIVSLFNLGFATDERVEERLHEWKRSGKTPEEALPGLAGLVDEGWDRERFVDWVQGHGKAEASVAPAGRLLDGAPPASYDRLVGHLVAALDPLGESYPLPHYLQPV